MRALQVATALMLLWLPVAAADNKMALYGPAPHPLGATAICSNYSRPGFSPQGTACFGVDSGTSLSIVVSEKTGGQPGFSALVFVEDQHANGTYDLIVGCGSISYKAPSGFHPVAVLLSFETVQGCTGAVIGTVSLTSW